LAAAVIFLRRRFAAALVAQIIRHSLFRLLTRS
jgi:hypothetical protein